MVLHLSASRAEECLIATYTGVCNAYEKMLWQMGSAIRDIASLIRPMRAGTVLPIAIERRPDKEEPDEYYQDVKCDLPDV